MEFKINFNNDGRLVKRKLTNPKLNIFVRKKMAQYRTVPLEKSKLRSLSLFPISCKVFHFNNL